MNHRISRLHYLTQDHPELSHQDMAEAACKGGVDWVQLRVKGKAYSEWKLIAGQVSLVCQEYNAKLIINDNPMLAKEIGAEGVHLGKKDMDPTEARALLGPEMIIGGTANSWEDMVRLAKAKVDYIGLGPLRFTTTKKKLSPVLGVTGFAELTNSWKMAGYTIPIIAIGGIQVADTQSLLSIGLHGIAVSSAINLSQQPEQVVTSFLAQITGFINEQAP